MEPRTSRSTPRAATVTTPAAFALARAAELVSGPMEEILPTLSAALAPLVAHTVAAELSGHCAHSPFKVHGDAGAARITVTDLRALGPLVTPGRPWQGTAVIGGEERAVVAVASEAAPMAAQPPLLVLVRRSPGAVLTDVARKPSGAVLTDVARKPSGAVLTDVARKPPGAMLTDPARKSPGAMLTDPARKSPGAMLTDPARKSPGALLTEAGSLTDADSEIVQHLWDLVTGHRARLAIEAVPGAVAQSRSTAAERARVIAELGEAHEAALTALLGVLRSKSLEDGAARSRAVDLAVSALVALRAEADRNQELTEEPAAEAFARLADSLKPLLRHSEVRLEVSPPEAETAEMSVPADVAHLARAAVRALVLAMAGQQDVRRIHVRWRLANCQLVAAVRDDGPGELPRAALDTHRVAQRLAALGGTLAVDALPGWGTTVTATLPLGTAPGPRVDPLAGLHPREAEVLGHLAQGHRNRTIAEELHISESTVKFHVANILAKLGVSSRGEAAALLHSVA